MPAKVTSARSVARLTDDETTPGAAAIAFSTRLTQEAQVMPSMPSWITGSESDPAGASRVMAFIFRNSIFGVAATDKGSSDGKVKS
ncbi:hypothetical protein [Mesorhizobium sp. M1A.F.Ca.IN.022.07.1.1]|uniref:hypothetical protein n=1 Tax=Mesorhizobium sp. M1A.F.Ca.IN.022.07.1.1 TaxID=2496767 RepID=UPI0019D2C3A9|nr:hypothetical protein [Mesorhizobium sp. M1A.F.Ca.IN.022.07.1.1]